MSLIRFFVRYFYAPAFFVGFIGAAIYVVQIGASGLWLLGLFLAAIATSFIGERILPFEEVWNRDKGDTRRDVWHAVINEVSNIVSVAIIPLIAALGHGFDVWPTDLPLWAQLGIAIFVADFGITLTHYASHKIEVLWRLHAVHHSVKRMYGFNGLMKHPLHQTIELVAGTTPLMLMNMPLEVGALLGLAVAIQLMLQHANIDMRVGPLIYIWAVAPGHRHHHIASKTEGDVNFGLFTMIWDHLLGSFVKDRPQPRDGDLGVAGWPDFPETYGAQLLVPFRKWDGK